MLLSSLPKSCWYIVLQANTVVLYIIPCFSLSLFSSLLFQSALRRQLEEETFRNQLATAKTDFDRRLVKLVIKAKDRYCTVLFVCSTELFICVKMCGESSVALKALKFMEAGTDLEIFAFCLINEIRLCLNFFCVLPITTIYHQQSDNHFI